MLHFIFLAIGISLILITFKVRKNQKYRYPPGPYGIPIFGSLFEGKVGRPYEFFSKLRKEYGDVITVQIAGETVIVLNSLDVIRECFIASDKASVFSGRPQMVLNKYIDGGKAIASMDYSATWIKLRKIIHKCLHMYGEGVDSMEQATLAELKHVVTWVDEHQGQPFCPEDVIVPSSINSLSTLILGKRLNYDDKAHQSIMDYIENGSKVVSIDVSSLIMRFPFLRHLPFSYGKCYQDTIKALNKLVYYMHDKPKQSYRPSVTRGLLDMLLRFQEEERKKHGHCWLDDDMVKMNVKELLAAGSVTTRGSLTSFFLIAMHKPEVVENITREIDTVIGQGYPSLKHKPYMPYTEATIWELMRYIAHVPLAVPHSTTADVQIREYFIPAGTTVLPNFWEALHDEKLWDQPWEFRPERFLDTKGNFIEVGHEKRKNMLAFGLGKRICPGESFARSRIFLFITILLQRFNFRLADGAQHPSSDPRNFQGGFILQPPPYKLQATPRGIGINKRQRVTDVTAPATEK